MKTDAKRERGGGDLREEADLDSEVEWSEDVEVDERRVSPSLQEGTQCLVPPAMD